MMTSNKGATVWAVTAADGVTEVEVCQRGDKYVVVICEVNGLRRLESARRMALETAKQHATFVASKF